MKKVDIDILLAFYEQFAESAGDVTPIEFFEAGWKAAIENRRQDDMSRD